MKVFAYILLPLGSRQREMSIVLGEPVAIVISEGKPQVNIECWKDNNDFEGRR